jgi:hypothetical protein
MLAWLKGGEGGDGANSNGRKNGVLLCENILILLFSATYIHCTVLTCTLYRAVQRPVLHAGHGSGGGQHHPRGQTCFALFLFSS